MCLKVCICLKYLVESELLYLKVVQYKLEALFLGERHTHVGRYIPKLSKK